MGAATLTWSDQFSTSFLSPVRLSLLLGSRQGHQIVVYSVFVFKEQNQALEEV